MRFTGYLCSRSPKVLSGYFVGWNVRMPVRVKPVIFHSGISVFNLKSLPHLRFLVLGICAIPVAFAALTSAEVVQSLKGLSDGNRANAIATLARSGQISPPISGVDGGAILEGATQGARASAIAELAPLIKADLSGQEAAAILGSPNVLSDGNRANAIAALARAKRFGPSIGEDAALALKGATQGSRATAVAEIAPYLRGDLPGQALAAIVGPASDITDGNRANAIAAIARSVKKPAPISGFDGGAILEGATQGSRASAIAELAPLFKADLSGQEAAAILGSPNVLSDGNRANAIAALIKAGKLSAAFTDHLPSAASVEVSQTTLTTSENASSAQLDVAKQYWIYAAMSNNVYGNKMVELPIGWQSLNAKYGDHGFYAETFIRKEHGKIKDIVVAFRGTEGVVDWALGNLINLQQGDANEYVGEAIAKLGRFSVTLTGHSLGGALAQNVANNIGLSAIVFDSSPMDGFEYPTGGGGKIISISEQGEALALIRTSLRADVIFNFINDDEGKIENHKMYPLAAGMKLLAQPTNN